MQIKPLRILLSVCVIDQISKQLVLALFPSIVTINPSRFEYVLLTVFILIFLLIFKRTPSVYLVFSAGFSNLLDRVIRGGVVDFIALPIFAWKFNLADLGLTIGVIWFIYDTIIRYEPRNNF